MFVFGVHWLIWGYSDKVEDKIAVIRNLEVIADADVAELYGVQTKEVNQAVRNNRDKFPAKNMFELNATELRDLRSKFFDHKCVCDEPQFYQGVYRARDLYAGHYLEGRQGS